MKVCVDCKYFRDGILSFCKHPNNGVDPVYGDVYAAFASINRNDKKRCSEEARWFEEIDRIPPAPSKPWWKIL